VLIISAWLLEKCFGWFEEQAYFCLPDLATEVEMDVEMHRYGRASTHCACWRNELHQLRTSWELGRTGASFAKKWASSRLILHPPALELTLPYAYDKNKNKNK
jgi:hypothetical protein